ncbi:MAG: nucleotidyltransferase family protein [Eubacteriales bacterium]
MKNFDSLYLTKNQRDAVLEAKRQLGHQFPVQTMLVFGSVARGENDYESDLDLLVITSEVMTHRDRNTMSDIIFEINYNYGTNLSIVVVDAFSWNKGVLTLTPLYTEIKRDGVIV